MKNSTIEWTTHTFNPWIGCAKVSAGCARCYAERDMDLRRGRVKWGVSGTRSKTSEAYWKQPLKWNREAFDGFRGSARVFCASLADLFEDRAELVPWRRELWDLIERTDSLDWLLLTKRPENIRSMVPARWTNAPRHNVWYGTSVENQETAHYRLQELCALPAAVRFVSYEPALGPVNFGRWFTPGFGVDWIIVGGESGPGARAFDAAWARSTVQQCQAAGVACFVKQMGSATVREGLWTMRDPKGADPSEWPADLRVREIPMARTRAKGTAEQAGSGTNAAPRAKGLFE